MPRVKHVLSHLKQVERREGGAKIRLQNIICDREDES